MHFRITWEFLETIYTWALSLKDSDLLGLGDVLACLFGIVYLSDSDVKLVFQVFLAHCLPTKAISTTGVKKINHNCYGLSI